MGDRAKHRAVERLRYGVYRLTCACGNLGETMEGEATNKAAAATYMETFGWHWNTIARVWECMQCKEGGE